MALFLHSPSMHWFYFYNHPHCTGSISTFTLDALVLFLHSPSMHWFYFYIYPQCTGFISTFTLNALVLFLHSPSMHWLYFYIHPQCTGFISTITLNALVLFLHSPSKSWFCHDPFFIDKECHSVLIRKTFSALSSRWILSKLKKSRRHFSRMPTGRQSTDRAL